MDLVKFVMYTLVSRAHMPFFIPRKGHTVTGNQGTHDKLNQIHLNLVKHEIDELTLVVMQLSFAVIV